MTQLTTKPLDNRKELARLLVFARKERNNTVRQVADKLGCSQGRIEAYEDGRDIPTGHDWEMYCNVVSRSLRSYSGIRLAALADRDREGDRKREPPPLKHNPLAAVAKLDITKPTTVALPPVPPPTPEPAPLPPPPPALKPTITDEERGARASRALNALPRGWKSTEAREQRQSFALDIFRQRPNASLTGADSVEEALRRTFGVGMNPQTLSELREQARREIAGRPGIVVEATPQTLEQLFERRSEIIGELQSTTTEIERVLTPKPEAKSSTPEDNIRTAVELVLESIPNLLEFNIRVDEHGEAHVDYKQREVRIIENAGSLKVKVTK